MVDEAIRGLLVEKDEAIRKAGGDKRKVGQMHDKIMFIDFDGTITTEETLSGAMQLCVDPEMFKDGNRKLLAGEWTLKKAVSFAFDHIPSSRMGDIMEYVRNVPIREGLSELLDKMKELGIPVVIISGGLKPYVEEKLEPFMDRIADVYSIDVDISGPYIRLIVPDEGETDLIEKTDIMKKYQYKTSICIGDGLTDVRMALASDIVFARDTLAKVLTKKETPFVHWDNFHDVIEAMGK